MRWCREEGVLGGWNGPGGVGWSGSGCAFDGEVLHRDRLLSRCGALREEPQCCLRLSV